VLNWPNLEIPWWNLGSVKFYLLAKKKKKITFIIIIIVVVVAVVVVIIIIIIIIIIINISVFITGCTYLLFSNFSLVTVHSVSGSVNNFRPDYSTSCSMWSLHCALLNADLRFLLLKWGLQQDAGHTSYQLFLNFSLSSHYVEADHVLLAVWWLFEVK
jgi:hypothetical protein